jgi:hypothetical protein
VGENPARWKGHLDQLLPARSKVRKVRHHPALPYAELPDFMVALRGDRRALGGLVCAVGAFLARCGGTPTLFVHANEPASTQHEAVIQCFFEQGAGVETRLTNESWMTSREASLWRFVPPEHPDRHHCAVGAALNDPSRLAA